MTRRESWVAFRSLLALVAPFKAWIALAVLLGACTVGSSIGLMAASAYIIASAALHPSIADLAVPIVGVRFFGIARGVSRYCERYVSHYVSFNLLARLRVWFYTAIEPLAPAQLWHASYRSGDLLSRVIGDIETLQNFYVRILAPPLVALVIAVLMGATLFVISPVLAFVVLGLMFCVGIVLPLVVLRLSREDNRRMVQLRGEMNTLIVDGIQGIGELIVFGCEETYTARLHSTNVELAQRQTRMARLAAGHNAFGNLLAHFAMWAALVVAIPLVTAVRLDGVYLPVIALAVLVSFEGVLALPGAFQYLETHLQAAHRLFELADGARQAPGEKGISSVLIRQPVSARVENLSFRYAPDEPYVLDGVSFDLPAGKKLAIVGPSGAGKSTLIHLMLRFWDVPRDSGRILIGGYDLRDFAPETARQFFSVVAQPTHLFNATIRENLLLACPDATATEIARAVQHAQLADFISTLKDGYDTLIGEQGLRLSGGERQRLAIARAFLKDAPILLLDEPTANLDPLTEREVLQAIQALISQRTTLMITHRLVGLDAMDEIILLDAGRIVERGRQNELLRAKGAFWRMYQLQNQTLDA